jgi:hypothetical protein
MLLTLTLLLLILHCPWPHLLPPAARSEFVSAIASPGEVVSGVRHEDLQQLSFEDNSFDLVLSTEVGGRVGEMGK